MSSKPSPGQNPRRRKPQPPRRGSAPNKRVRYFVTPQEAQNLQRSFFPFLPHEKPSSIRKLVNQLREAGLVRPTRKVKDGIHTAVGIGLTRAGEVRMSALRLVNLPRLKNVPQNERMKMIVPVVLDIMHEIRLAELERMILQTVHDPSRAAKVKTTRYIPPVSKEMVLDALIKYSVHDEADRRRSLQKGRADDFHSTVLESMRFLQARLDVVGEALKIVDSPTLYRQLEGKSIDIWYDAQYWRGRERMNDRIAEWMRRKK